MDEIFYDSWRQTLDLPSGPVENVLMIRGWNKYQVSYICPVWPTVESEQEIQDTKDLIALQVKNETTRLNLSED
jgi:hypothetical protein